VAEKVVDFMGATKKFVDFMLEFLPEPPPDRPPELLRCSWEHTHIVASLRKIYEWRSRALHGGIPFPPPMCMSPVRFDGALAEKPLGVGAAAQGGVWTEEDMPMLLYTFEYLVQHALVSWWISMLTVAADATDLPPEH
jgi:hypothetical protein